MRRFILAFAIFGISSPSFSFDQEALTLGNTPVALEVAESLATLFEPLSYGECANVVIIAGSVYASNPEALDISLQASFVTLSNGLRLYRSNYVALNSTAGPLDDIMRTISGDYASANLDSLVAKCSNLTAKAYESTK